MIQLIDLMILFVGCYIITKMLFYLFREDFKMVTLGMLLVKLMAGITIMVTIVCIILALLSFAGTLGPDIERYLK